jgi:hypothetical protein
MRFAILTAAAAALASLATAGSASAQVGFGIYVGPSGYYDDYEYAPPAYRSPGVYGYTSTYEYEARPDVVVRVPGRRAGCGEYFYWNGARCVDARINPPDVR